MSDIHVTREILRALERGDLSVQGLSQILTQHLENLCPVCREEVRAWEEERTASRSGGPLPFQALGPVLARHAPDLEARRREAERDFRDLLALSPAERFGRVERARGRFRGMLLAERLIEESRLRTPADPREGYHLAELARAILHRSPGHRDALGLVALASARMANALRAGSDLRQADEQFRFVRRVVSREAVTDPWVLGQIDHLEGSLRKDQRRFEEAEALLSRSAMLFRISGAVVETARALLTLGALLFQQGSPSRAIEVTRAALTGLSPSKEPRLYLSARHNLALYLAESGRYEEEAGLVAADAELYRSIPEPWLQLRLSWLRGKIAAGMGDAGEAERWLRETRDGFVQQGNGYDAAMVSLDLTLLYLKEGRTADVRALAEEMVALFEARDVHREALAALRLFQEAASREEVTAARVRELAGLLERVPRRRGA